MIIYGIKIALNPRSVHILSSPIQYYQYYVQVVLCTPTSCVPTTIVCYCGPLETRMERVFALRKFT